MGLLKKIFGSQQTEPTSINQRRIPRVQLSHLHEVSFKPKLASRAMKLGNISLSGMALLQNETQIASIGPELRGVLTINKKPYPVVALLRHQSEVMVGFEFSDPAPDLRQAIASYLQTEILALTLYAVNSAFIKPDPRGKAYWYSDSQNNEIYFVCDITGVLEFHMSFHGNYVEGGRNRELRGGQIHDDHHDRNDYGHKASSMLYQLKATEPEMLRLASSFAENVLAIPAAFRKDILAYLLLASR